MKASNFFFKTLREDPKDAEATSHKLLIRASLIKQVASGVYAFMPLGHRVLKKIEQVVREEMDNIGAQEMTMSILMPGEMWKRTGRWDLYGDEMFKLKDRKGQDFCLGPTHEEQVTTLVSQTVSSYKQLPLTVYQINTKFRDEPRPRFGLIRLREFVMKDAYSFHDTEDSLRQTYDDMRRAYERIMERLGLDYEVVSADPGAIGGSLSQEFIVPAPVGESTVFKCHACGYVATSEIADAVVPPATPVSRPDLGKVYTPNVPTVETVAKYLGLPVDRIAKSMMVLGDSEPYLILLRGDRTLDEAKMNRLFKQWRFMEDAEVEAVGGVPGFIGPFGLSKSVRILRDKSLDDIDWVVVGANERDYHITGVSVSDLSTYERVSVSAVEDGDYCPRCGSPLASFVGLEVGHIFRLGTRYSEPLDATYLDKDGNRKPFIMGCYGIGVTRLVSAIIEQYHDEYGIKWPWSVAPFHVVVIPIGDALARAEAIYGHLKGAGFDVLLDDRDERPGVKFMDADLVGFPVRVVVSQKNPQTVELKFRRTGATLHVTDNEVVEAISAEVPRL